MGGAAQEQHGRGGKEQSDQRHTDETAGAYRVTGLPTSVVIRPDGIVHAMHLGVPGDYVETMKREIIDAFEIVREAEEADEAEDE